VFRLFLLFVSGALGARSVVAYPEPTKTPQQFFPYALAASSGGHEYQIEAHLQAACGGVDFELLISKPTG
jgi:hypothetical protein